MIKLYSGRILELAGSIPLTAPLEDPQVSAMKRSPLCGSTVTVSMRVEDGRIVEYAQDVKACALGQASAAISGAVILGLTREQVQVARDQLHAMLKSDGQIPAVPFDGFEVLIPARAYKNRHASILLTLDATLSAFDQILQDA